MILVYSLSIINSNDRHLQKLIEVSAACKGEGGCRNEKIEREIYQSFTGDTEGLVLISILKKWILLAIRMENI